VKKLRPGKLIRADEREAKLRNIGSRERRQPEVAEVSSAERQAGGRLGRYWERNGAGSNRAVAK
jgi:hypothetical protein